MSEDLTHDKIDEEDVVLIARLAAQLRCYEFAPQGSARPRALPRLPALSELDPDRASAVAAL
jgi:hypothetical protein